MEKKKLVPPLCNAHFNINSSFPTDLFSAIITTKSAKEGKRLKKFILSGAAKI